MDDIEERPSKIRKLESSSAEGTASIKQVGNPIELQSSPHNPAYHPPQNEHLPDFDSETTRLPPDEARGTEQGEQTQVISKSQLKKQRRKEQWEAGLEDRRLKRKEKRKEKQARKATVRAELAAQATASPDSTPVPTSENGQAKANRKRPVQVPIGLVLDCDFNELMTDKEIISLAAQLTRCYSDNKTAVYRSHLAVSSWGGKLQERFEGPLCKNHLSWKGVRFISEDFVAAAGELHGVMRGPTGGKLIEHLKGKEDGLYGESGDAAIGATAMPKTKDEQHNDVPTSEPPTVQEGDTPSKQIAHGTTPSESHSNINHLNTTQDLTTALETSLIKAGEDSTGSKSSPADLIPPSIVYLSSDSPDTLFTLSPYTTYIVGGIVDKNRHKGICYKRARALGIPTAKLPIGEYMTMQSRTVLTVNHVVEIMLKWLEEGDWGKAFLKVIPKRKEAKLRGKGRSGDASEENDEGSEREIDDDDEGDSALLQEKTGLNASEDLGGEARSVEIGENAHA